MSSRAPQGRRGNLTIRHPREACPVLDTGTGIQYLIPSFVIPEMAQPLSGIQVKKLCVIPANAGIQ